MRGNAILFFGDKRFRAQHDSIFLCEPMEVHGMVNDTDDDLLVLVFKINAKEDDNYWIE
ncbi:MAG: AraC family ligand binding domain-containing protein [Candidatus Bathyarchaeota archaeon]|nr:AraC family ligand binding domain-containing protein [Candidatus Bathyarchaeota archaeon]MDH5733416.1 AraC family ligand binding domain-containing protein [Candidatus Bathyarchaeota archaeon]